MVTNLHLEELALPTVTGAAAVLYAIILWMGIGAGRCFGSRRRSVRSAGHRTKRTEEELYTPLLEEVDLQEGGIVGSPAVFRVKVVYQLWTRQVLGCLEVVFHLVLACYIVATREALRNEGLWLEACVAHVILALAWCLCILAEEYYHRTRSVNRVPLSLLAFYAIACAGATCLLVQLALQLPLNLLIHIASAWNVVPVALVTLLALWGAIFKGRVLEYELPPTPEQVASLYSYVLFMWFAPVITKGLTKRVDASDLPELVEDDLSRRIWEVYEPLAAPLERRAATPSSSSSSSSSSSAPSRQAGRGDTKAEGETASAPLLQQQEGEEGGKKPEPRRKGWRLMRTLFSLGAWDVWATAIFQLIGSLAVFAAPLAMQRIIHYLETEAGDEEEGGASRIPIIVLFCTACLFLGPATQAISDAMNFFIGRRLILRYRSALISLIFRKALRLDMSCENYSVGELTNLQSVDANSVEAVGYIHFVWSCAIQIFVCIFLIFNILGWSAVAGLGFMLVSVPITAYATKKVLNYQTTMMQKKDERMSIITEVLHGIRIIKMFAWERDFKKRIEMARENEISYLRRFVLMRIIVIVTWDATPTLVALCTFVFHTLVLKRTLTASAGFAALALFDLLRFPLVVLPDMINYVIKSAVSFGRIEAFLEREEVSPKVRWPAMLPSPTKTPQTVINGLGRIAKGSVTAVGGGGADWEGSSSSPQTSVSMQSSSRSGTAAAAAHPMQLGAILIQDASFRWGSAQADGPATLSHINLSVAPGSLVCIYGPTGAGKTSLLMSMLGEINKLHGSVVVNGRAAFVSQKSWIRNMTLRANILFGKGYNADHYTETVACCALKRDLEILEGGDLCEIGEKGVNLSGGQQQRVNLARATYQTLSGHADIVIMDDVLSAVDAHVGQHIFEECICGSLAGRTRVLVTHQVALTLPKADYVVIMGRDGCIVEQGSRAELQDRAAALLEKYGVVDGGEEEDGEGGDKNGEGGGGRKEGGGGAGKEAEGGATGGGSGGEGKQLIKEEEREEGHLKMSVYIAYFKAMGGIIVFLFLLGQYAAVEGLRYEQTRVLGTWVTKIAAGEDVTLSGLPYIYLSAAVTLVIFIRALTGAWSSLRASLVIHKDMVARVIRAPTSWFDTTPVGRVQNRFSSDMETIDKNLMDSLTSFLECLLNAVAVAVVVSARMPPLLAGMLPILALAFYVGRCYLKSSRELKRLESTTRSPIYSHFSETVVGVSTVRAYGVQTQFIRESEERVDNYNRINFYLWAANRWLGVRLQLLGAACSGMVGVYILATLQSHTISSTTAGLVLLYSNSFSSAMNWLIRNQAELEMNANSVERTEEYCAIPQEAAEVVSDYRPPKLWPNRGEITVSGLTVRYSTSSNPVIRSMSFYVPPGTRVGVVGRTGAGKSSLLAALYRLVEPEAGHVMIDGVDTSKLGLTDLRSRLAVVPQDPTLFRGTVRSNMDPFDEFQDEELWDALRRAHLAEALQSKAQAQGGGGGLALEVTENGGNMSVGEKQLLCMARALLRKRAVLVMDEATANVDPATDGLIQETLKREFGGCSVLTVAHRLHTVVFYDRVLVMEQGVIVEYDTPVRLLSKGQGGVFYSMCERTGDLDRLIAAAKEADRGGSEEP